jgi:GntR family transcriptional regulator
MTVSSDATRYTIADDYRQMILSGELPDGAPLPSVVDIAEQYGVSKDLVTRAFRLLQADGLIRVGRKGALPRPSMSRLSWTLSR